MTCNPASGQLIASPRWSLPNPVPGRGGAGWRGDATGAGIEHLGLDRGHRTLIVTRKGGKVVTVPLAPRTARAIDLAIGERAEGPLFLAGDGRRLDRHAADRIVRTTARRAGITKPVTPHTLRHAFITAARLSGGSSQTSVTDRNIKSEREPLSCVAWGIIAARR